MVLMPFCDAARVIEQCVHVQSTLGVNVKFKIKVCAGHKLTGRVVCLELLS